MINKLGAKGVLFAAALAVSILAFSARRHEPVRLGGGTKAGLADLRLPALNGGTWSMEQERGKVVVLNFWATWCAPCRAETPELVKLHERYRDRGFTVVGVSLDDDPAEAVPPFVDRHRIPYPMVLPGNSALAASIESLPTTLLIGRDGRVAETYLGAISEEDMRADIERLLAAKAEKGDL